MVLKKHLKTGNTVIKNPININPSCSKPLGLTNEEKKDGINFMKALTDKRF